MNTVWLDRAQLLYHGLCIKLCVCTYIYLIKCTQWNGHWDHNVSYFHDGTGIVRLVIFLRFWWPGFRLKPPRWCANSTQSSYWSCPKLLLRQLPSSPAPQCISSGDSPVAVTYQLQQPWGCSVSALSPREKPSEHSESWRTQVYYTGGLRGDGSLESEPRRGVSQGFYGLVLPGPCLADQSENCQVSRCRCVGEGWLGQLAGLCLVIMAGVSFLHFYQDIFSYTVTERPLWLYLWKNPLGCKTCLDLVTSRAEIKQRKWRHLQVGSGKSRTSKIRDTEKREEAAEVTNTGVKSWGRYLWLDYESRKKKKKDKWKANQAAAMGSLLRLSAGCGLCAKITFIYFLQLVDSI